TYPVGNGYDAQGRMTKMTNWTSFPSAGARVTTWNYDQYNGRFASKVYDDGKETGYGYTDAGRLKSRLWARGTNTAYTYSGTGDLASVAYNDGSTSAVINGYDRLGHRIGVSNDGVVNKLTYNDADQMTSEVYSNGPLAN